ncbi:hypothetical protein [Thioalkalivibrio sp.]|uniref:hypothetical protein n=1 Tax=Thioalkalivibrio sp. TaxID=2093813 RepID=UPI0012D644C6|nr:hypothetical protein [Thioalkalivibrio sp.]TVP76561.1 MAG: hypothetical protein EA346_14130 [Thioalkalivibrio sp.]
MRLALVLAMGMCLLATQALADTDTDTDTSAGTDTLEAPGADEAVEEPDEIKVLTAARAGLYGASYWLVENVDSWFGEIPFEEDGRVSGSLRVRGLYREDDGFSNDVRYRLRVQMPNVSETAYLFIGRDNEEELVRDESSAFARSQSLLPESRSDDQTLFAGIGYFLRDNLDLRLGVRGGYKLFAQARYRKIWWLTDDANLEFRQTLFLAVDQGLGTTSAFDYAQALTPRTAFRWRNSATISTETDGAGWSTSLGLFQAFDKQRELSLEVLARGETDAPVPTREYGVRGIWSQPIYRDWMLGEVILGHFWRRDDDDPERESSWAAGLGIEMRF